MGTRGTRAPAGMYATINKVSLLGIINYEVAKTNNSKTFFIHLNISMLPGQGKSHNTYVENTKMYLNEKGVKFSTETNNSGTLFTITD
jgi:hypothetical protein